MTKRRRRAPALVSFPSVVLDELNRMDRSTDPLTVATAALTHHAYWRRRSRP